MPATIEEKAESRAHYARRTIIRAAEILEATRTGTPWSANEAFAEADRELRATQTGRGATYSLIAIKNAVNSHLQKEDERKGAATPLERIKSGPEPKQAAATLRLAAPMVAAAIRNDILEEEIALEKLAQTGATIEEMDRMVRDVRGLTGNGRRSAKGDDLSLTGGPWTGPWNDS